jgi:hypothetical protein
MDAGEVVGRSEMGWGARGMGRMRGWRNRERKEGAERD